MHKNTVRKNIFKSTELPIQVPGISTLKHQQDILNFTLFMTECSNKIPD